MYHLELLLQLLHLLQKLLSSVAAVAAICMETVLSLSNTFLSPAPYCCCLASTIANQCLGASLHFSSAITCIPVPPCTERSSSGGGCQFAWQLLLLLQAHGRAASRHEDVLLHCHSHLL
jgi:hypothetical protein